MKEWVYHRTCDCTRVHSSPLSMPMLWFPPGRWTVEKQPRLHETLIDRCSSEASVSREWLLSGQESPVNWLDDDRWCGGDESTSWIKHKGTWHWKIAWLKSVPGLVSSSPSWGENMTELLDFTGRTKIALISVVLRVLCFSRAGEINTLLSRRCL